MVAIRACTAKSVQRNTTQDLPDEERQIVVSEGVGGAGGGSGGGVTVGSVRVAHGRRGGWQVARQVRPH